MSVKRLEIELDKEPTELQKKSLKKLAQGVERLKANQKIFEAKIATLDRDLARGLNRWRKAWTDVDKVLLKVWRDAGRLIPDDNSDTDNERPAKKSDPKDKEERKRAQSSDTGLEEASSASSEFDPAEQRRTERRQNDISDWRRSVESTSQGGNADTHSPENRNKTKRASMYHNQSTRWQNQGEAKNEFLERLGDPVTGICDQRTGPQPSVSREHRNNDNSRQIRQALYASRPEDKPPSPINSQHSSAPMPPFRWSRLSSTLSESVRGREDSNGRYQERHRSSRSRTPSRDRHASRDEPEYQDRVHPRVRTRDPPEEDRRSFRYQGRKEQHR